VEDARDRMIDGTVQLLATRGLQATSFREVVALTGAPRGSIYHHFPDGKQQMVAAALERASDRAMRLLRSGGPAPANEVAERFVGMWRALLVSTDCSAGCSVAAVTTAADASDLLELTGRVFATWRRELADLLERGGLGRADAEAYASTLIAACEGAVVVSRAERSVAPFDQVADFLLGQIPPMAP
jgi:TetR/AcrR family transcriptional regulator, lmrAB and yxaGH operons repressor